MDLIEQFFKTVYNVPLLIKLVGFPGLMVIVFAETGLMVGFFLPGDSLLVTAGVFAAKGWLNIYWLIPVLMLCGGRGQHHRVSDRPQGRPRALQPAQLFFFRREHLIRTHEFYERHGGKTIILAQFMPIVRTFAPVVAGAAEMPYRRFATFNVIGAVLWINSMLLTGFFLVRFFPVLEERIDLVVAVVIFLSLSPAIIAWAKSRLGPKTVEAGT